MSDRQSRREFMGVSIVGPHTVRAKRIKDIQIVRTVVGGTPTHQA